jgi:hypothetical protein
MKVSNAREIIKKGQEKTGMDNPITMVVLSNGTLYIDNVQRIYLNSFSKKWCIQLGEDKGGKNMSYSINSIAVMRCLTAEDMLTAGIKLISMAKEIIYNK